MRAVLWLAVALGALFLAVAATQPAVLPGKLRVAVADFEVVGGRPDLGSTLANALEGPLFRSGRFELYDRRQTGRLLEEFRFAQSGLTEAATRTLQARNIDVLVTGTVNVLAAGGLQVSFRFINVSTAQLQFADSVRAGSENDFDAVAQALVAALSRVFPLRGSVIGSDPSDARRHYVNLGFGSNLTVGQAGDFYRSEPLASGGSIERRAGSFRVVELTADPDQAVIEVTALNPGYAPKVGDSVLIATSMPAAAAPAVQAAPAPPAAQTPPAAAAPRPPATPWTLQGGGRHDDRAGGVAVDGEGNVYLAGSTHDGLDGSTHAGAADAFLVKYAPDGSRAFTRQWGTTRNDVALAVAVDPAGNVFVAGETSGALDGNPRVANTDAFLTKFTPDGRKLWTRQWGSRDHLFVAAVAADANGAVVAGAADDLLEGTANQGDYDAFLTRFDAAGKRLGTLSWGSRYRDEARGVALDRDGNALVAGGTGGSLDGHTNARPGRGDAFLRKVAPDGKLVWAVQWGGSGDETAEGVAVDASGGIWVAGTTDSAVDDAPTAGERDLFLSRFDAAGKRLGTSQWGGPLDDWAGAVTALPGGGAAVAGGTAGALDGRSLGRDDAVLTRVGPDGQPLWSRQFGGPGSDDSRGVASDRAGNLFVAGSTDGLADAAGLGERDYFLLSFSPAGARR
ncbi:MAG TPA: SBBP repeat-containing protein [Deinococcales bacterium]|nr:SBBP repeat-containing protein [Deinococcales bacterium]